MTHESYSVSAYCIPDKPIQISKTIEGTGIAIILLFSTDYFKSILCFFVGRVSPVFRIHFPLNVPIKWVTQQLLEWSLRSFPLPRKHEKQARRESSALGLRENKWIWSNCPGIIPCFPISFSSFRDQAIVFLAFFAHIISIFFDVIRFAWQMKMNNYQHENL